MPNPNSYEFGYMSNPNSYEFGYMPDPNSFEFGYLLSFRLPKPRWPLNCFVSPVPGIVNTWPLINNPMLGCRLTK